MLRSVHEIGYVEVDDVITSDDVWIHCYNKISPLFQKFFFIFEGVNFRTHNRGARAQNKDVANTGRIVTLDREMVCNLNDRIMLSVREVAFASCTLNVERQDSEGGKLAPLAFGSVANEIAPKHVDFNLAVRRGRLAEEVLAGWSCDPISTNNVSVDHEAHDEENIAFIGQISSVTKATETDTAFENALARGNIAAKHSGCKQAR